MYKVGNIVVRPSLDTITDETNGEINNFLSPGVVACALYHNTMMNSTVCQYEQVLTNPTELSK